VRLAQRAGSEAAIIRMALNGEGIRLIRNTVVIKKPSLIGQGCLKARNFHAVIHWIPIMSILVRQESRVKLAN
jgi:hypothetical protein